MPRETEWSGRTLAQQERHPSSSDTRSSYLHQTPYGQAPPPRAYSQGLSDPRGSAPHSYDARVAAPGPARAEWDRPAAGRSMNPSSSVGMSKVSI